MNVLNIHERYLDADSGRVGALIDSLSSRADRLWPGHLWPRMRFDRQLGVGARGGHGPIGYVIDEYVESRSIRFRFTRPRGFDGGHGLELVTGPDRTPVLRHTLKMTTRGLASLAWPLFYRPLHDALVEDALAAAEHSLGLEPTVRPWSLWVRSLRWLVTWGRAPAQSLPPWSPE
jgi:hypothetical protein